MSRCYNCHRLTILLEETLKDANTWRKIAIEQVIAISEADERTTLKELKNVFKDERKRAKKKRNKK